MFPSFLPNDLTQWVALALLLDLLLYWMSVRFGAPFYPPRDLLLQGWLLIHLWAAVQCNTVDIRGLSQVDLKNGLKLMVLANKLHSLISGKICLRGQLAGGHHTRSEPPGCSGRTRKWKRGKEAEQAGSETRNLLYLLKSLSPQWQCLMWKTSLKFGLWSALSYFCPSWAISVCVCVCVFVCGVCALVHVPL